MSDTKDLFPGEGERRTAGGNRPFLLDDPDAAWVVLRGRVEIFAVPIRDGQAVGARDHCARADPGEAFFGMDLSDLSIGLLAVGRAGTELRRIDRGRLQALAGDDAHRATVVHLVDTWVGALSRSLTEAVRPLPLVEQNVLPALEATLETGDKARSNKGVLWLEAPSTELMFVDLQVLSVSRATLLPVTTQTWVEATEPVTLTAHSAAQTIDRVGLWAGLELFHACWCHCAFLNTQLSVVDEFNRLKSKAEYAEAADALAVRDLVDVLEQDTPVAVAADPDDEHDTLFEAMRLVGEDLGLTIIDHPDVEADRAYDDRVAVVAKASGVQARVVALRDDWWNRDQGPILARMEDGLPVALLPRGPRAYVLVDPVTGIRTPVNEAVADGLRGLAHVLYRPFRDGVLNALDLLRFGVRGLGKDFVGVAILGVVLGLVGVVTPLVTGRIFDSAIPEAERGLLGQFALALAAGALASTAFTITQNIAVLRIQGRMDYSIQAALWDRLLDLPSRFFRTYTAGDLADRAGGVSAIRNVIAGTGVTAVLTSISSVFFFGLMFWYSIRLGAVALGLTVVFVTFTTAINLFQLRFQHRQLAVRGRLTGLVLQLVTGVGKLRVAGAESHAFRVWASHFSEQRTLGFTIGRIQNAAQVWNSSFPILANMVIFGSLAAINDPTRGGSGLTTGQFIAFSAAFGQFLAAAQGLSDASLDLVRVVPLYRRMQPIISTEAEIDDTRVYPGKLKGAIELSHVHFRYQADGPWVVKDVSLRIEPGEFIAFVGPSGSGKSTLMRLMLGFEIPEKGTIYYDGQDLGNLDLRQLRQQLGVVLQESRLLPADIFRNIVGTSSRTIDDAWEAARMAGFDGDIRGMPMGIHTYVAEGGVGFSGGQKQRLLIARAIVNRPRIVFMDEATSALDNRIQATVTESLDRLQATRIVIAHRLSTVVGADRICYLENGAIVEMGTYDELMRKEGRFHALAMRQMA